MKKKILSAMFAVAIMTVAGYNVYMNQTKNNLSELALANIEALADDTEGGGQNEPCGKKYGNCWVSGGFCLDGEYTINDCIYTGYTNVSCETGC